MKFIKTAVATGAALWAIDICIRFIWIFCFHFFRFGMKLFLPSLFHIRSILFENHMKFHFYLRSFSHHIHFWIQFPAEHFLCGSCFDRIFIRSFFSCQPTNRPISMSFCCFCEWFGARPSHSCQIMAIVWYSNHAWAFRLRPDGLWISLKLNIDEKTNFSQREKKVVRLWHSFVRSFGSPV